MEEGNEMIEGIRANERRDKAEERRDARGAG